MRVKPYPINKGQKSQFFVLVTADQGNGNNFVLTSSPNKLKTEAGAIRWAEKNGYKVRKPAENAV
ncbi:MAG: hypothetical protein K2H43_02440, partial [Clostridia bacterium]|nr:hypothetical protein [Clostridia bacterium]